MQSFIKIGGVVSEKKGYKEHRITGFIIRMENRTNEYFSSNLRDGAAVMLYCRIISLTVDAEKSYPNYSSEILFGDTH